jgi:hypothetical protein
MLLMDCKKFRFFVILSLALFVLGLALQLPRALSGEVTSLTTLLSGLGLLSIVLSPVVIIAITLLSLFPATSRRLDLCNH